MKPTYTPAGAPENDRMMELLKPPLIRVVANPSPALFCTRLSEDGVTASVNPPPPPEVTVRVTVTFCKSPPPLPVTMMGYVPAGVLLPTMIVMVELPAPGAGMVCGLKVTDVPLGAPEEERLTGLLKPPLMVVVICELP